MAEVEKHLDKYSIDFDQFKDNGSSAMVESIPIDPKQIKFLISAKIIPNTDQILIVKRYDKLLRDFVPDKTLLIIKAQNKKYEVKKILGYKGKLIMLPEVSKDLGLSSEVRFSDDIATGSYTSGSFYQFVITAELKKLISC